MKVKIIRVNQDDPLDITHKLLNQVIEVSVVTGWNKEWYSYNNNDKTELIHPKYCVNWESYADSDVIGNNTSIHKQLSIFPEESSRVFDTGAKRDSNTGKIRPDLISPYMLKALGKVLAEGANHYGDRNWEKGMPQEVFKESASRHYISWLNNEEDEDHAAKLIFNVMAWIHFRDKDYKLNK